MLDGKVDLPGIVEIAAAFFALLDRVVQINGGF